MNIRDPELFHRALRAAAGVTGVLRKGAMIGVAAGAFTLAGCGSSHGKPSTPGNAAGGGSATEPTAASDAIDAPTPSCDDDPGYNSDCCKTERAAGRSPMACTPWGPPAPPAYAGERLAAIADQLRGAA